MTPSPVFAQCSTSQDTSPLLKMQGIWDPAKGTQATPFAALLLIIHRYYICALTTTDAKLTWRHLSP